MSVIEERTVTQVAAPEVTRRDVLHRAADLLEEFGWEQACALRDGMRHGPTCILGAVHLASIDLEGRRGREYISPFLDSWRYLSHVFSSDFEVWAWNDRSGRTKAEVVARLREAAESAE